MFTQILRATEWLNQICCSHVDTRQTGEGRIWLECGKCGRQTPGIVTARSRAHEPDRRYLEAIVRMGDSRRPA